MHSNTSSLDVQCMVFEHMAHGDLHEFLIFHSPKSDLNESEDSGEGRVLTQSEMSYIAIQIAAGEDIKICDVIFICFNAYICTYLCVYDPSLNYKSLGRYLITFVLSGMKHLAASVISLFQA
jgi:hypothetical protein